MKYWLSLCSHCRTDSYSCYDRISTRLRLSSVITPTTHSVSIEASKGILIFLHHKQREENWQNYKSDLLLGLADKHVDGGGNRRQ